MTQTEFGPNPGTAEPAPTKVSATRQLGQTGRSISAIGLGCMGMSEFYGPRDDAQSRVTLEAALDIGIDFLDTADMYGNGHNEELLGDFLKGRRDRVTLATKFAVVRNPDTNERSIDNSPAYVQQACEASLKRLGIETIDLYYCHRRNPATPIEDMVGAMGRLVETGKVRAIGLSEVSPATLRAAHAVHPITAVQSEYSLWSREPEAGMLAACAELGVTFVAYSPLGRGFLTGAIQSTDVLAESDFRRHNPRFQGHAFTHNRRLAEALAAFAEERHLTAAQIALAWLISKHGHVVAIPGSRHPQRLKENAAAADIKLSAQEIATLEGLFPHKAAAGERYNEVGMKNIEAAG